MLRTQGSLFYYDPLLLLQGIKCPCESRRGTEWESEPSWGPASSPPSCPLAASSPPSTISGSGTSLPPAPALVFT